MNYSKPSTFDWLVKAAVTDTQRTAKNTTDLDVLRNALAAVQNTGQKTKARIIEARIKRLEKQPLKEKK